MLHAVKKPFGWYPDGYTREALNVGDERDFGDAASGLLAEGLIGIATASKDYVPAFSARDSMDDTHVPAPANEPHPLDHDGDGRKGGSLPGRRKRK